MEVLVVRTICLLLALGVRLACVRRSGRRFFNDFCQFEVETIVPPSVRKERSQDGRRLRPLAVCHARDASGDLVLLEDQDRTRWDRAQIDEGAALVEAALSEGGRPPGPYALQAAIAALHAQAATAAATDWQQIAALYGVLARVHPTPVVELNRAVAVAMSDGLERGLALLDTLDGDGGLAGYHLLSAARAELLRRLGRHAEAGESYRQALALVSNEAERRHLERRLREVTS